MPLSFFAERVSAPPPNTVFGGFAGDVLGGIVRVRVDPGVKMRHRGMIAGVYVRPALRGTGLALRLMEASIAQARLDGLDSLRLEVSAGNDNARALYASIGFQTYGIDRRAVRVGDVYVDEEMMTLSLI